MPLQTSRLESPVIHAGDEKPFLVWKGVGMNPNLLSKPLYA